MRVECAAYWVRCVPLDGCLFPCSSRAQSSRRLLNRLRFSSFFRLVVPLQSSFALQPRCSSFDVSSPAWVSALTRLHFDAATICAKTTSSSLRSVRRFSQPLDGFFRIQACRLIPSCCHAQGSVLVQGLLFLRSRPLSSSGDSSALLLHRRSPTPSSLRLLKSRPRAMPLSLEALLCVGSRSFGSGYSPRPKPLPSSSSINLGSCDL